MLQQKRFVLIDLLDLTKQNSVYSFVFQYQNETVWKILRLDRRLQSVDETALFQRILHRVQEQLFPLSAPHPHNPFTPPTTLKVPSLSNSTPFPPSAAAPALSPDLSLSMPPRHRRERETSNNSILSNLSTFSSKSFISDLSDSAPETPTAPFSLSLRAEDGLPYTHVLNIHRPEDSAGRGRGRRETMGPGRTKGKGSESSFFLTQFDGEFGGQEGGEDPFVLDDEDIEGLLRDEDEVLEGEGEEDVEGEREGEEVDLEAFGADPESLREDWQAFSSQHPLSSLLRPQSTSFLTHSSTSPDSPSQSHESLEDLALSLAVPPLPPPTSTPPILTTYPIQTHLPSLNLPMVPIQPSSPPPPLPPPSPSSSTIQLTRRSTFILNPLTTAPSNSSTIQPPPPSPPVGLPSISPTSVGPSSTSLANPPHGPESKAPLPPSIRECQLQDQPFLVLRSFLESQTLPLGRGDLLAFTPVPTPRDSALEEIVSLLRPHPAQILYRESLRRFFLKHVRFCLGIGVRVFEMGLSALQCPLPDDPVRLSVIHQRIHNQSWHTQLIDRLCRYADTQDPLTSISGPKPLTISAASFDDPESSSVTPSLRSSIQMDDQSLAPQSLDHSVDKLSYTNSDATKGGFRMLVMVDGLATEIQANRRADLVQLTFIEEVAQRIDRNQLFKRSLLLVRAWWNYETSYYFSCPVKHYLSDSALTFLLCAVFNQYHELLHHPLQVLCAFLAEYADLDWANSVVTLQGIVPFRPSLSPTSLDSPSLVSQSSSNNQPWLAHPNESHLIPSLMLDRYWAMYNLKDDAPTPEHQPRPEEDAGSEDYNDDRGLSSSLSLGTPSPSHLNSALSQILSQSPGIDRDSTSTPDPIISNLRPLRRHSLSSIQEDALQVLRAEGRLSSEKAVPCPLPKSPVPSCFSPETAMGLGLSLGGVGYGESIIQGLSPPSMSPSPSLQSLSPSRSPSLSSMGLLTRRTSLAPNQPRSFFSVDPSSYSSDNIVLRARFSSGTKLGVGAGAEARGLVHESTPAPPPLFYQPPPPPTPPPPLRPPSNPFGPLAFSNSASLPPKLSPAPSPSPKNSSRFASLLSFPRRPINILHPISHANLFPPHHSRRHAARVARLFQIGARRMNKILSLSRDPSSSTSASLDLLIRNFFRGTVEKLAGGWRPDLPGGSLWKHLLSSQPTSTSSHSAQYDLSPMCVPLEGLWERVLYANLLLEGRLSRSALFSLARELLLERGALPVGEIGKALQEASALPLLSTKLKEKFGGLKKFLEMTGYELLIGTDHPFNPHVYVRSALSPEDLDLIAKNQIPPSAVRGKKTPPPNPSATSTGSPPPPPPSSVNSPVVLKKKNK